MKRGRASLSPHGARHSGASAPLGRASLSPHGARHSGASAPLAGLIVPLSALRSESDFGVGDMGMLPDFFGWMRSAGLRVLQILPLNDLEPEGSCPYSSLSAFALDTAYVSPADIPEIAASPALAAEIAAARAKARRLRTAPRANFAAARRIKRHFLEKALAAFESATGSAARERRREFARFRERQADWLGDYGLFRSIKEASGWSSWRNWPAGLKNRRSAALSAAGKRLAAAIRFHEYSQWILFSQWESVRRRAREAGVLLFGDIPFGLDAESADVWSRASDFDFSVSMGAPPDQYSRTGQAWGLPGYRWARMDRRGHVWWRRRIRHARDLFDIFRIDHAVGFFRTWMIRRGRGANAFDLAGPGAQERRGRRFFSLVLAEGRPALTVAEDLGVIPDFVYAAFRDLGIPGYKIPRWLGKDGEFPHPKTFPRISVANSANHDTDTTAAWWNALPRAERDAYWRMVAGGRKPAPRFSPAVNLKLIENLFEAGSFLALVPFQDLFGRRERINVPGTVSDRNWTYRVPWTVSALSSRPELRARARALLRISKKTGRA